MGISRFTSILAALAATAVLASGAQAAVPSFTQAEGVLSASAGGLAADGVYKITFGIYKDETGGNPVWVEGPVNVGVKNGQWSAQLGTTTPLSAAAISGANLWLGMQVGSDPELPRKPLGSVSFALRAALADGLECSGCITAAHLKSDAFTAYVKSADLAKVATSGKFSDLIGGPDLTGYLKSSDLAGYAKTADLGAYAKTSDLGAYTKTADLAKVATSGKFSDLTGGPDLSSYAKTADLADYVKASALAKVAGTGSYTDLSNTPTAIQIGKACGTGLVMKGIKADGSYDCASGGGVAADMIDEVSNGLIYNQFVDKVDGVKDIQIKDGFSAGTSDTVAFPSVGQAQKLWIEFSGLNSDMSKVVVELYAPNVAKPYILYNGGKTGTALVAKYNDTDALVSGDLNKDWLTKDIVGNWTIIVKDTAAIQVPPGTPPFTYDGKYNWSVNIQTLSSKKIQVKGNLIVDGSLAVGGAFTGTANGVCNASTKGSIRFQGSGYQMCDGYVWINTLEPAIYRWAVFSTYGQAHGNWYAGNNASLFGGVNPSNWTNGCYRAVHMSSTSEVLRTLLFKKGPRIGTAANSMVYADEWYPYSSTNGRVIVALFRVRNTTGSAVNWNPQYYGTSWSGWDECQGISMNGNELWSTGGDYGPQSTVSVNISVPANRTSTIIFSTTSSSPSGTRSNFLAFYNNSLKLPNGLEFVDDLDVKPDGWDN